jgi:hypothetical protein
MRMRRRILSGPLSNQGEERAEKLLSDPNPDQTSDKVKLVTWKQAPNRQPNRDSSTL